MGTLDIQECMVFSRPSVGPLARPRQAAASAASQLAEADAAEVDEAEEARLCRYARRISMHGVLPSGYWLCIDRHPPQLCSLQRLMPERLRRPRRLRRQAMAYQANRQTGFVGTLGIKQCMVFSRPSVGPLARPRQAAASAASQLAEADAAEVDEAEEARLCRYARHTSMHGVLPSGYWLCIDGHLPQLCSLQRLMPERLRRPRRLRRPARAYQASRQTGFTGILGITACMVFSRPSVGPLARPRQAAACAASQLAEADAAEVDEAEEAGKGRVASALIIRLYNSSFERM